MLPFLLILASLPAGATSAPAAPTPTLDDARAVIAKAKMNAASIATLSWTTVIESTALDGTGRELGVAKKSREHAVWDRAGRKMKWRHAGEPLQAYVADGLAGTRLMRVGSATHFEEGMTEAARAAATAPFPSWLWSPDWLLPLTPDAVERDGLFLVLVSGRPGDLRRRIWLEPATGCVRRIEDVDAGNAPIRRIEIGPWRQVDAVWVPETVDEKIFGHIRGLHRVITFSDVAPNAALTATEFDQP